MMKLLIVDDEPKICSLIYGLVDWHGLSLTDAGRATSGEQALDMIREKAPDIVLTDIRMPGMSGLELVEQATSLPNPPRFIIMSGYTQFEYAYTAVKFGVEDFLLKPLDKAELNTSLSRLATKLKGTEVAQEPEGARVFLQKLVSGLLPTDSLTIERLNHLYGCSFGEGTFQAGLLHIDYTNSPDSRLSNVELRIRSGFAKMLSGVCHACLVEFLGNGLTFVLNYAPQNSTEVFSRMELLFREISALLNPYEFALPTLTTGAKKDDVGGLPASLLGAQMLIDARLLLGTERWHTWEDRPFPEERPSPPEAIELPPELTKALELLQFDEVFIAIIQQWHREKVRFTAAPYALMAGACQYARQVLLAMKHNFPAYPSLDSQTDAILKALTGCAFADTLDAELATRFRALIEDIRAHLDSKSQQIITVVRGYILRNLNKHIVLEDIAREVYLSPAYLGSLFRQQAGVTFSTYLTEVRMEQAKKYLRDIRYAIADVSCLTGYRDPKHFSKVFKKVVGVKPSEYRKIASLYPKRKEHQP